MTAASLLLKTLARQGETFTKRSITDALMSKGMRDAPRWVAVFIDDLIAEGKIHSMGSGLYMVNGTHKVHNPCGRRHRNTFGMRNRFLKQLARELARYVNRMPKFDPANISGYASVLMKTHKEFVKGFGITKRDLITAAASL